MGWQEVGSHPVVCTPAPWRANFRDGIPVAVWFRGRRRAYDATLDDDPARVAALLQSLADRSGSLRSVGIDIPSGHRITAADVAAVDRAIIHFTPRS